MSLATTRGALIRGTTTDALGDEIDGAAVVPGLGDFPVSIIEREAREYDPDSNVWRTVRKLVARTSARVTPQPGDRLKDLRDGTIYSIGEITRTPRGLSGRSSVTMGLKRTGP